MGDTFLPLVLYFGGITLIALELIIPSGGLLSILSGVSFIASVVVAFMAGTSLGIVFLVLTMVAIPVLGAAAIYLWPQTPLGRMILVQLPEDPDDVLPDTREYREFKQLIGRDGVAKSQMLTAGDIIIEGRTYDAVSDGEAINPGDPIRVIEVRGNHIVVRKLAVADAISTGRSETEGDWSDQIEGVLEDPFEDPLS